MKFNIDWHDSNPEVVDLHITAINANGDDLRKLQNALYDAWDLIQSLNGRKVDWDEQEGGDDQ